VLGVGVDGSVLVVEDVEVEASALFLVEVEDLDGSGVDFEERKNRGGNAVSLICSINWVADDLLSVTGSTPSPSTISFFFLVPIRNVGGSDTSLVTGVTSNLSATTSVEPVL
jgi:hypothetical protein